MIEEKKNGNQNRKKANDSVNAPGDWTSKTSSFFALSEQILSSERLRWLIIALLPVLILLKYPVDRVDYDLWWQMAHGKYYLAHHTLRIDLSVFSWTPTDPSWIYNTCLGSIIVYLLYNFMGGFGLWLMQTLVFLGIFLSFYLFLRLVRRHLDINSATLIAAIAIVCSISCRYYKPELFSALLFSWAAYIFFYIKITRRKFLFYLYPLIFVFWVNLHGAFIIGLVFIALAFAGEVLNRFFFSQESFSREELVHFGIACFLSAMATLINPYGVDYLASLQPAIMSAINFQKYSGPYDKFVLAYQGLWPYLKDIGPNFLSAGVVAWIMTLMISSVLILTVYELIRKKSCDFSVLIISLALFWKGMGMSRASYFFPVAFFFIFFYLLVYRLKFKNFAGRAAIFSLSAFIFFFITVSYFDIRYGAGNTWFGRGLDQYVPAKEVAFLKKYKLEGPIFNDYVVGGYLVWDLYPDYKVFIDPRGGLYGKQVFPDYMEFTMKHVTSEDIRRFREKYPFKIAIFHFRQMVTIFDFLKAGDEWRLLYFEKNAAILIHKSLLPALKSEAGNVNLSPLRFRAVKDPEVLVNVFNFYVRLDPKAGRYIYDVFKRNISDFYKPKPEILQAMDMDIKRQETEIQKKDQWLSPS